MTLAPRQCIGYVQLVSIDIEEIGGEERAREKEREHKRANEGA